jgi:glutamyl-tRNA synthetase
MPHSSVRTRVAPSPTGEMHVGSMSILLKNYAFAKKHQGSFILRIEDTDQSREVEGATEHILKTIKAYGLNWDEGPEVGGEFGPYVQSERLSIYQERAHELVNKGQAYFCTCSPDRLESQREAQRQAGTPPKYDRHCLERQAEVKAEIEAGASFVIRLLVPTDQTITFTDLIRGEISVQSGILDDQVLLKSDGFPTYHLAVVVDDHLMKITHIFRGEEWISSTPKHILLYQAFGWPLPVFGHIPVFLNPDGKGKMSKRKGTVSAQSFLDTGYLPEALLNFFMILGWTPKDQREILSLEEYINEFDPQDISAKSVVFDLKKLDWLNGLYIRNLSIPELMDRSVAFLPADFPLEKAEAILPLIQERLVKLSEIESLTDFFYRPISHDPQLLCAKSSREAVIDQLNKTVALLENMKTWTVEAIEQHVRQLQTEESWHPRQYFMMLRLAATGRQATPPLFDTLAVIGQNRVIERLIQARDQL